MIGSRKTAVVAIDALVAAYLLLAGVFFAGVAHIFAGYGESSSETDTILLTILGAALFVAGLTRPLKNQARSLIALALLTIAAIPFFIAESPDVIPFYLCTLIGGVAFFFLRRHLATAQP